LQKRKATQRPTNTIPTPPILQRQLLLWLVMSGIAIIVFRLNAKVGLSLLWGFSLCMLPAACFTLYANKNSVNQAIIKRINNFYRAEAVKMVLTAILFALVFKHVNKINVIVLFLAFIAAQICSSVLVAQTLHKYPR
jgi:ATP synthase protein I